MCVILVFWCFVLCVALFFFFNDTATTEIYTLSLHDALPISTCAPICVPAPTCASSPITAYGPMLTPSATRSEEHTSELQSRLHLVCRLLLEKKKKLSHPAPGVRHRPPRRTTCAHLNSTRPHA